MNHPKTWSPETRAKILRGCKRTLKPMRESLTAIKCGLRDPSADLESLHVLIHLVVQVYSAAKADKPDLWARRDRRLREYCAAIAEELAAKDLYKELGS